MLIRTSLSQRSFSAKTPSGGRSTARMILQISPTVTAMTPFKSPQQKAGNDTRFSRGCYHSICVCAGLRAAGAKWLSAVECTSSRFTDTGSICTTCCNKITRGRNHGVIASFTKHFDEHEHAQSCLDRILTNCNGAKCNTRLAAMAVSTAMIARAPLAEKFLMLCVCL